MVRQLISMVLFQTQHELFPRLLLHGLERAQQGSWCRIPGFPWTDRTKDWESQQGGQDLLMRPEVPHFTPPTPVPALSCPKPSWREQGEKRKSPAALGWVYSPAGRINGIVPVEADEIPEYRRCRDIPYRTNTHQSSQTHYFLMEICKRQAKC